MKTISYLKLVSSTDDANTRKERPSIKNQFYIGLFTILAVALILASTLLLPPPANAEEVYGVEFGNIHWDKLCPNVKPVSVGECDVVHPTSGLARNFKSGFESLSENSQKPNCDNQKKIYDKRIASKPRRCAAMFQTAYSALVTSKNNGVFSAAEFRDKYLSEGVVNANALLNQ